VTLRVILIIVVVLLVVRAVGRFMGGLSQAVRGEVPRPRAAAAPVKMMKDPVCGTFVVPGKALSTIADGTTVFFCSERCRDAFAESSRPTRRA
jgi:YHS domain-containing protein